MAERPRAIALFGAPGTGKGTQGKVLGTLPGFYLYGSGEALRTLDPQTPVGRRVHELMKHGDLVPDEVVIDVWRQHLADAMDAGKFSPESDFLVLDGLIRTPRQLELVCQHAELVQVIHLACYQEDLLIDRLHRRAQDGRLDDVDEQVIRHRLQLHEQETRPVLDALPPQQIAEVDALASPLEVLDQIVGVLIPLQQRVFAQLA